MVYYLSPWRLDEYYAKVRRCLNILFSSRRLVARADFISGLARAAAPRDTQDSHSVAMLVCPLYPLRSSLSAKRTITLVIAYVNEPC